MQFESKDKYGMKDLLHIVHILRAPGGCPWDAEQTHQSIRKSLIEETYEVAEAIDLADADLLCEELGDLLLQVVMHTQMEAETGGFTFADVCDGICKKLIYRHPHVFGDVAVLGTNQVLENWEALKNAEKSRDTAADRLDSVPACFPALMRSAKVQKRAADYQFCYPDAEAALFDLESEVAELRQAMADGQGTAGELGDVLFSAVSVARMLDADPEEALTRSTNRFAGRVKAVECMAAEDGKNLQDLDDAQRDLLWRRAKAAETAE